MPNLRVFAALLSAGTTGLLTGCQPDPAALPDVLISRQPPKKTNIRTAHFEFTTSAAHVECALGPSAPTRYTPCTSGTTMDYSDVPDGANIFFVRSTDEHGNSGKLATYSWEVRTTPPTITFAKKPPSITTATSAVFRFNLDPSYKEYYQEYDCSLDDQPIQCVPGTDVSIEGLHDRLHTFTVHATDLFGNQNSDEEKWTVDTTPPLITLSGKPTDPSVTGSASFTFAANEMSTFQCQLDTLAPGPCTSNTTMDYSGLPDGPHTFTLEATDLAGNSSTIIHPWTTHCATPSFFVDASNPNANDGNPGTSDHPFKTITHALLKATSGQTIQVRPGTYGDTTNGETMPISIPAGVCLVGDVTTKGAGTPPTVISGGGILSGDTRFSYTVTLDTGSTLAGFLVINNGAASSESIGVLTQASSPIVHSNTIRYDHSRNYLNGPIGIFLTGDMSLSAVIANTVTAQFNGLSYSGTGTGGKAELNELTGNRYGLDYETSAVVDFGGGTFKSDGGNTFSCNTSADAFVLYVATLPMANNLWDHIPPTLSTDSPAPPSIDIEIVGTVSGHNSVVTTGAALAPNPCLP